MTMTETISSRIQATLSMWKDGEPTTFEVRKESIVISHNIMVTTYVVHS